jgi:hypothetical protein
MVIGANERNHKEQKEACTAGIIQHVDRSYSFRHI